jgi:DNA-binding XRE family transcriptional regulator
MHPCVAKLPWLQAIEFTAKRISVNYPRQFNHIGGHIKATRLDRELRQKEVAKTIGATKEIISHWESGIITKPALKHWIGIIKFLRLLSL